MSRGHFAPWHVDGDLIKGMEGSAICAMDPYAMLGPGVVRDAAFLISAAPDMHKAINDFLREDTPKHRHQLYAATTKAVGGES